MPDTKVQFRAEAEAVELDLVHRVQVAHLRMGKFLYSGLCPMDEKLYVGQLVHVTINPERLYFFDTITGKRL
jgi:hypothetical protein